MIENSLETWFNLYWFVLRNLFLFSEAPQQQQPQQNPLLVEMNQVPVSLPLRHDPPIGWAYSTGPHISNSSLQNLPHSWVRDNRIQSLCTNHPATAAPGAPHLQPCQVHTNVFPQPFAQNCHYTSFATTPQLTQMQPQSHQPNHYHHHMQQVCVQWQSKKIILNNFRLSTHFIVNQNIQLN